MAESAPQYRHPDHADGEGAERQRGIASPTFLFWSIAAILIFAVAFGGGGSKYGMANLIVQLAALIALSFHRRKFITFWKSAPTSLRVLIALSVVLPLLYIVPLPSGLWQTLPGRELVAQSFDLVGGKDWASASVDPIRTLLAATALIVPIALLAIGWSATRNHLILIGWIAVGLGLANFVIGIPQVLSNSEIGVLFPENSMPGVLFGSFANRNSTGLFLVGVLALATFLPPPERFARTFLPARIAVCLLILVAIVLTRSRTALVLAFIPLGLVALRVALDHFAHGSGARKGLMAFAPIALILVVLGGLALAAPGRLGDVAERFERTEDARTYIWDDAAYSASRYWPVGSGTGTFDDVFQVDESLENMTPKRAGRAHNDYLEVAIEAGVPGLALILGWLALVAWLSWRARRGRHRWIAWSGATILLAIALQSITDYPLRNLSMMALASYALLMLLRFGTPAEQERQEVLP